MCIHYTTQSNDQTAPLKGSFVPTVHHDHPLAGQDCFFGIDAEKLNCTCTDRPTTTAAAAVGLPRLGCYGPKCTRVSKERFDYTMTRNFTCGWSAASGVMDCSGNEAGNNYLFGGCRDAGQTIESLLNRFDHEFRFESITPSTGSKTIVKCPLPRKNRDSNLIGWLVSVFLRVNKVRESVSHAYATEVLHCNATAIESDTPMRSAFTQLVQINVLK